MNAEKKKKIILGVTGGIAAYKSAELCSLLCKASYDVHVIMTANAQKLMTERCFLTLSRNPVICNLWDVPEWRPEHIELSESADLLFHRSRKRASCMRGCRAGPDVRSRRHCGRSQTPSEQLMRRRGGGGLRQFLLFHQNPGGEFQREFRQKPENP